MGTTTTARHRSEDYCQAAMEEESCSPIRIDRGTGDQGGLPQVPEYSEQVDTSEANQTGRCNTATEDQHRGEAERGG